MKMNDRRPPGAMGKEDPAGQNEVSLTTEELRQVIGIDTCWKGCCMEGGANAGAIIGTKEKGREVSRETLARAFACDTPEDLMKLAQENGIGLTREQAEMYIAGREETELSGEQLRQAAGGNGPKGVELPP